MRRVFKVSFLMRASRRKRRWTKAKGLAKGAGLNDETSFRERKSGSSVGEPDPVRFAGDILLVYKPSAMSYRAATLKPPEYITRCAAHKVKKAAGRGEEIAGGGGI